MAKVVDVEAFKARRLGVIYRELKDLQTAFFELAKQQAKNAQRQTALLKERDRLEGKR